jgi:hypothetical protein
VFAARRMRLGHDIQLVVSRCQFVWWINSAASGALQRFEGLHHHHPSCSSELNEMKKWSSCLHDLQQWHTAPTHLSSVMRWKNRNHSYVALDFETAPIKLIFWYEGCAKCPGCHCVHSVNLSFLIRVCSSSSNPYTAIPHQLPSVQARDWNRKHCYIVILGQGKNAHYYTCRI